MGKLLEMRAEFALALADAGIGYELGDTKIANPDFLFTRTGAVCAGVEVTARAPRNINELVERVEAASGGRFDVDLAFDRYPSRLQPEVADTAAAAVRTQADALGAGSPAVAEVIRVEDPKNAGPVEIAVQVCPGNAAVGWEVTAGILDGPLGRLLRTAAGVERGVLSRAAAPWTARRCSSPSTSPATEPPGCALAPCGPRYSPPVSTSRPTTPSPGWPSCARAWSSRV
ncbi:hypothetical protein [Streptomyces mirabilis]|uniref:hypothetical protein n=1 Tax=Streptomyces mirabilis TaxID=68239 RepID=UPI00339F6AC5